MVNTLVIGLGGTGSYVVNKFAEGLIDRGTGDIVKTICVDTNADDLNARRNVDRTVRLGEPPTGQLNLNEVAKRVEWYPFNSWRGVVGGVGKIRPTSRFLLSEIPGNYASIKSAIHDAIFDMQESPIGNVGSVCIWIITSAGGGTGSGIFCDIARIAAHETSEMNANFVLNGVLILPAGMGLENVEEIGLVNSFAILSEIEYLNKNDGEGDIGGDKIKYRPNQGKLFNGVFLAGLPPILFRNADVGFESVKEEILPAFLETIVYGDMATQKKDQEAARPLVDWTDFITFSDKAAENCGRYYTFGISELSMDVNAYREFCNTHKEVQKLEATIRDNDEELVKVLNKKNIEFKIENLTLPQLRADKETYKDIFRGNLVYQKKYFDNVYQKVEEELRELRDKKGRLDKEKEDIEGGKEEVKTFIQDKKKEKGLADDKLWKEVLKKFKKGEEIGKNNLDKARTALEGRWIKSLINRIDSHIEGLKPEIENIEQQIEPLSDKIETWERIEKEVVQHVNNLESSIGVVEKNKEEGENNLAKIKESIINSKKKGLIATYPDFDRLSSRDFFDKVLEINLDSANLSGIIKKAEGESIAKNYIQGMIGRMQNHLLALKIDPKEMQYQFVWNVIACRDNDYVQKNKGDAQLAAGKCTGSSAKELDSSQKTFFPQAKWLFLQMVGGEPLDSVEDFEEFKDEYEKYPRKEQVFCYPEVAKNLGIESKKN
jgi:transcription elongation factor Elf1